MALNEKQQKVVDTINGPVMVVSCPGSGKTTVVVDRAKAIVDSGVEEYKILVITFTKASAEEMKARYIKKYGECNISFSTIHSACLFMLNKAYGFTTDSLIQTFEQWQLVQNALQENEIDDVELKVKEVIQEIGFIKNRDININKYVSKSLDNEKLFREIFKSYETYKKKRNVFDFDDILIICRNYLKENPGALNFWQEYYQYIMIDEYQDTNTIQAEIFYMLADKYKNICVVGDDDQAIYAFRAADSSIMMNFAKQFKDCEQIFMDTNYRSSKEIIDHAKNLIEHNNERFKKDFKVGNAEPGNVVYHDVGQYTEVEEICNLLKEAHEDGKDMSEYAILYRNNNQASLFTSKLLRLNVPFSISDTFKDNHDSIIFHDIKTYWRLANGPVQYGDLGKIINKPNRYLKSKEFYKVTNLKINTVRSILQKTVPELWRRNRAEDSLYELFEDIHALKDVEPKKFFRYLTTRIKYTTWLNEYAEYTGKDKDELKMVFDDLKTEAMGFETMEEWFDEVDRQRHILIEKLKRKSQADLETGVRLSTFHSSKGLEWRNVFIIDANEKITPFKKAETDAEIEEERRLFYVAMTRAKKELHIYYDSSSKTPSRFVFESQK